MYRRLGTALFVLYIPSTAFALPTACLPSEIMSELNYIQQTYAPIKLISTFRDKARAPNGKPSLHASCRAVDFRPASKVKQIAAHLRSTWHGGVGIYSTHIHIDNGPRARWIGRGEGNKGKAVYTRRRTNKKNGGTKLVPPSKSSYGYIERN